MSPPNSRIPPSARRKVVSHQIIPKAGPFLDPTYLKNLTAFPITKTIDSALILKEFSCFNRLPTEIRHHIWYHALPGPRVIQFRTCPVAAAATARDEEHDWSLATLYVCHESRAVTLRDYKPTLTSTDAPTGIYTCPSLDIISIICQCSMYINQRCAECNPAEMGTRLDHYENIETIQKVILGDWPHVDAIHHTCMDVLLSMCMRLRNLRTILVPVDIPWLDFFAEKAWNEDLVAEGLEEMKEELTGEVEDFDIPRIIAIREVELLHMNWIEECVFEKIYAPETYRHNRDVSTWEESIRMTLTELSEEDKAACLQAFCLLPGPDQICHLERLFQETRLRGKTTYLRNFYGI